MEFNYDGCMKIPITRHVGIGGATEYPNPWDRQIANVHDDGIRYTTPTGLPSDLERDLGIGANRNADKERWSQWP